MGPGVPAAHVKTKRKHIKVGMTCTFNYPGSGQRSKRIDCK
jgi:hypothetical protein